VLFHEGSELAKGLSWRKQAPLRGSGKALSTGPMQGAGKRSKVPPIRAGAIVPAIEQMLSVLRSKANHRMPREFFLDIFEGRYGTEEALDQLETLIDWGRFAEILAYDEHARTLFLEAEEVPQD
jgi:hypothetical protein